MLRTRADLVCAVAVALTALACHRDEAPARTEGTAGTTGTAALVRVAELVAEPERYFGSTVTVVSEVEAVLGPRAFALNDDSPPGGSAHYDLLVFSRNASNLPEVNDQWLNNKVRVTGIVRRISVAEVEREVGWDLNPEIEDQLERAGAVLIATSVSRVDK